MKEKKFIHGFKTRFPDIPGRRSWPYLVDWFSGDQLAEKLSLDARDTLQSYKIKHFSQLENASKSLNKIHPNTQMTKKIRKGTKYSQDHPFRDWHRLKLTPSEIREALKTHLEAPFLDSIYTKGRRSPQKIARVSAEIMGAYRRFKINYNNMKKRQLTK